jgi:hypothetical protein
LDVVDGALTPPTGARGPGRPGAGQRDGTGVRQVRHDHVAPRMAPTWLMPPRVLN